MADEDADESQKTEEPSGKRLGKAREEGNVPMSQEVRLWLGLIGTLMMVGMFATPMAKSLFPFLTHYIEFSWALETDEDALRKMAYEIGLKVTLIMALPFATLIFLGVMGSIGQVGWLLVWKRIMPSFSKINPLAGAKRLFSPPMLVEFVKSLMKFLVVGWIAWLILSPKINTLTQMPELTPLGVMIYIQDTVVSLVFWILLAYIVVSSADLLYQRYSYKKKLRMTKQEVKEEHKDSEGDPAVKSKQRSLRMQRARQRMLAAVPKATVVITNPTHYAVALHYDMETMNAPVLVAKGVDFLAQKIRELADEHEVPIVENPPLARALYASVELEQTVPQEHYKAVAEVIGYVFKLKKKI
jgi:flagellar biosynthetic protein FlhB